MATSLVPRSKIPGSWTPDPHQRNPAPSSCFRCAGVQSVGFSAPHKLHCVRRAKQMLPQRRLGQVLGLTSMAAAWRGEGGDMGMWDIGYNT